jgi:hypothetical protein
MHRKFAHSTCTHTIGESLRALTPRFHFFSPNVSGVAVAVVVVANDTFGTVLAAAVGAVLMNENPFGAPPAAPSRLGVAAAAVVPVAAVAVAAVVGFAPNEKPPTPAVPPAVVVVVVVVAMLVVGLAAKEKPPAAAGVDAAAAAAAAGVPNDRPVVAVVAAARHVTQRHTSLQTRTRGRRAERERRRGLAAKRRRCERGSGG